MYVAQIKLVRSNVKRLKVRGSQNALPLCSSCISQPFQKYTDLALRTISDAWTLHSITLRPHLAQRHIVRGGIVSVHIMEDLPLNIYYKRARTNAEKLWTCPLISKLLLHESEPK